MTSRGGHRAPTAAVGPTGYGRTMEGAPDVPNHRVTLPKDLIGFPSLRSERKSLLEL